MSTAPSPSPRSSPRSRRARPTRRCPTTATRCSSTSPAGSRRAGCDVALGHRGKLGLVARHGGTCVAIETDAVAQRHRACASRCACAPSCCAASAGTTRACTRSSCSATRTPSPTASSRCSAPTPPVTESPSRIARRIDPPTPRALSTGRSTEATRRAHDAGADPNRRPEPRTRAAENDERSSDARCTTRAGRATSATAVESPLRLSTSAGARRSASRPATRAAVIGSTSAK